MLFLSSFLFLNCPPKSPIFEIVHFFERLFISKNHVIFRILCVVRHVLCLSSFMPRPTSLAVLMTKESKHCASSMLSERRAMPSAKSVSVIYVAGNLRLNLCVIVRPSFSRFLVKVCIS